MQFIEEQRMELAREVLNQIENHPETVDMHIWGLSDNCGTTACIGGWVALLSGYAKYNEHGNLRFVGQAKIEYGDTGFNWFVMDALGMSYKDTLDMLHRRWSLKKSKDVLKSVAEGSYTER